jgi:hypothetical protein
VKPHAFQSATLSLITHRHPDHWERALFEGTGLHSANSAGGFRTGNGLAGAIVAMVVGLISMAPGGLALVRSRRTADQLTG